MGIWSTLSSNKYIQDIYIYIYLRIHYKVTGRVSRCRKYSTMRRSNLSSSGHSFPWALGKRLCLSSRLTLQCIFTHVSYIIPIFTLPAILENTQKGKTSSSYFFASLVNSLRSATSRWLHTLPSFCSVRYRKSNFTLYAKQTSSSSSNIVPFRIANIFTQLTQLLLGLRRLTRLVNDEDIAPLEDVYYPESDDSYRNYQVLILGATGRIGNIITKKLLLRGYRVRYAARTQLIG